jgi:hypothetical protein
MIVSTAGSGPDTGSDSRGATSSPQEIAGRVLKALESRCIFATLGKRRGRRCWPS